MRRANLFENSLSLTDKDIGPRGRNFLEYMRSQEYGNDFRSGIGFLLHGDAKTRANLLILCAKVTSLSNFPTWYTTAHRLIGLLTYGTEEERNRLFRVQNLYIEWFEKEFGEGDNTNPYDRPQRIEFESFLTDRFRLGRLNCFSSCRSWPDSTWWGRDFISMHEDRVRSFTV